jgi:hypothetical protein
MALRIFAVFAEAGSDDRAFTEAQKHPSMRGRVRYEVLDSVLFPSDKHAYLRAEDIFGVQPQADKVYIAGEHTNTVWAIRVLPREVGKKRIMFFGLERGG